MRFNRKDLPGKCPACHKGGYSVQAARGDNRPLFVCGWCGWTWTNGHNGGEFLSQAGYGKFVAEHGAISSAMTR